MHDQRIRGWEQTDFWKQMRDPKSFWETIKSGILFRNQVEAPADLLL